jgi:diacylglycerol kinase family enzyme
MNNVYIYDHTLAAKRYQKTLERLETRLTDLGLSGKIYRLAPMTRVQEIVREELKKASKTIVVVGSDRLITQVAGCMNGTQTPLGIIPIGDGSVCANALGIDSENACRILAARRIVRIDLGRVDTGGIFLSQLTVTANSPVLVIDGEITARTEGQTNIQIANVLPDDYGYKGPIVSPEDGRLNAYILKIQNGLFKKDVSQSSITCKQIELSSGPYSVTLDGGLEVSGVKSVSISPQSLSVIVGKERKF